MMFVCLKKPDSFIQIQFKTQMTNNYTLQLTKSLTHNNLTIQTCSIYNSLQIQTKNKNVFFILARMGVVFRLCLHTAVNTLLQHSKEKYPAEL